MHSATGVPYYGYQMPQIPPATLKAVFYLYPTAEAAELGGVGGGTAFIVGLQAPPGALWCYGVTADHCVRGRDAVFARFNRLDEDVVIIEIPSEEWESHPDGDDVAVCWLNLNVGLDPDKFLVTAISINMFVSPEISSQEPIGAGSDVFMVGRFMEHAGVLQNSPTVRFGNISMMPGEPVEIPRPGMGKMFPQVCYLVEMRSLPGFSGSPVFVYHSAGVPRYHENGSISAPGSWRGPYLLGVDCAHLKRSESISRMESNGTWGTDNKLRVDFNTGLACVVPASKVSEIIDSPRFSRGREQATAEVQALIDASHATLDSDA
jgi:hypothetical protein